LKLFDKKLAAAFAIWAKIDGHRSRQAGPVGGPRHHREDSMARGFLLAASH
jgi:hypothetical protein